MAEQVLVTRGDDGRLRQLTDEEKRTYVPNLPNQLFRQLNEEEQKEFRAWAHEHFEVGRVPNPLWHPIVREEWAILQEKAEQLKKEGYPGGKPFVE